MVAPLVERTVEGHTRRMQRVGDLVEGVHGASMATMVVLVVLDPLQGLRSAPDWAGWVSGQQRLDRVMHRVAPVLFVSTGVSAVGAALTAARRGAVASAVCRAMTAACVGAAIGVTLKVNEPINERLRTWRAEDPPPPDWRAARHGWEQAHQVRQALLAAGAAAALQGFRTPR